jgi:predicted hydrolase (HD superfamily)
MDRTEAYLLVKRQLRQLDSRQRARATEAIMDALATALGKPAEQWATMGLLLQLDLEYTAHNPDRRGVIARQQSEAQGLAPELGAALERCWQPTGVARAPLEHGLALAGWLAEQRGATDLQQALELARGAGDEQSQLLDQALEGLGLTVERTAELAREATARAEAGP